MDRITECTSKMKIILRSVSCCCIKRITSGSEEASHMTFTKVWLSDLILSRSRFWMSGLSLEEPNHQCRRDSRLSFKTGQETIYFIMVIDAVFRYKIQQLILSKCQTLLSESILVSFTALG